MAASSHDSSSGIGRHWCRETTVYLTMTPSMNSSTMNEGAKSDLGQSHTELWLGRYLDWPDFEADVCTPSLEQFDKVIREKL